ncbi:aspartyl/asparaginyl beta-hydroxylase domain-containing protein [Pseudoalteromonas sp. Of7M-16]|uniref:aspartyl/asparaginyl beta-hydroxylase domain-containing protein n=1 Tax=Pseudoalteromonas sp. Of7M-16 TaxID=2917756 RepID=UPI001EF43505|nr:aspartyl/asparaginyl beta-hydroxylase domain-containing protein [Pseudoalteromonas sp. Of7M-16]MCG7549181.1 aspartyl/asparaginyl beta-hydroxylase domain-containing protein [Pseudoalteromonas sp. Of7M-16]
MSFTTLSILYVYKFRGQARFVSFVEYLRKGWPIFAPLNVLLYLSTKRGARSAFVDPSQFKGLAELQDNWQEISKEVNKLYHLGYFEKTTSKDNLSFYDVGFRTFYKYGWSKFYCTWYGTTLNSAKDLCPNTIKLLEQIPSVNGAMFTILPAGSKLTRHLDPIACSFRYHLALDTPNSPDCFINVDGKKQVWRNGEAFIFDETYLHFVENNTDKPRLILMCDIERPLGLFGRVFNRLYKKLVRMMLVPNLPGDQAGAVNGLFSKIAPILNSAKRLKQTNKKIYYPIKWAFNTLLIVILMALIYASLTLLETVF